MGLGETNYYVENFQILCYNYYCIDIDNFEKEKYFLNINSNSNNNLEMLN